MAQGDDVCGEAVFQQDASVPLAVQLADETVPVDHEAWAEPAAQNTRERKRGRLAPSAAICNRSEAAVDSDVVKVISAKCFWMLTLGSEGTGRKQGEASKKTDSTGGKMGYSRD